MLIAATWWNTFYLLNNIRGLIGQMIEALQFNFSIATSFVASDALCLDSSCAWKVNSDSLYQTLL